MLSLANKCISPKKEKTYDWPLILFWRQYRKCNTIHGFVEWWCHFNALVFLSDSLNVHPTGIVSEWKKTQCMPREVCLDVGKEFGAATNTFYKPPCVSVYRCGGCCNSEAHQCMNISTSYISKTVSCTQPGGPQEGGVGVWVRVCVSVRMCVG